jgi:hypothetical protein
MLIKIQDVDQYFKECLNLVTLLSHSFCAQPKIYLKENLFKQLI